MPIRVIRSSGRIVVLATLCAAGQASAADCAVADKALLSMVSAPNHQYLSSGGGSGTELEIITLADAKFIGVNGAWTKSSFNAQRAVNDQLEKIKHEKSHSCQFLRDESKNGHVAALYSVHEETATASIDSKVWVDKQSGLPLLIELDTPATGHTSLRIDFTDVKPPAHFKMSAAG